MRTVWPRKLTRIDQEMHRELAELEKRSGADQASARAAALVAMLRARQRAELVKVPLFVELAQDAIAEGQSVAIFVCFRETLDAIVSRLEKGGIKSEVIHGGQIGDKGAIEREAGRVRFQTDQVHCMVSTIQAGGIGVSLHDGELPEGVRPRLSLVSPTWSAVQLRQALGRVHRAGGKKKSVQRIVFVAQSVEESVRRTVAEKLDRLDTLNDGDLGKPDSASNLTDGEILMSAAIGDARSVFDPIS